MALAWVEYNIILERNPAHTRREPNSTHLPDTEPPDTKKTYIDHHMEIIFSSPLILNNCFPLNSQGSAD
jgi:hypothetical protein